MGSHLQLLPAFGSAICSKLCLDFILWSLWMYFQNFSWLKTLKSKITNNFKIFHMMCIRCGVKVASTFKIYVLYIYKTYIVTLEKLVNIIKLVFESWLLSSAATHLVGIFIYS